MHGVFFLSFFFFFFFLFYIQPSTKLQGTILELMIYAHFFKAKRERTTRRQEERKFFIYEGNR